MAKQFADMEGTAGVEDCTAGVGCSHGRYFKSAAPDFATRTERGK